MIFSRIHGNNIVKQFLMEELNDKKIIVCAEVKNELINNYMKEVLQAPKIEDCEGQDILTSRRTSLGQKLKDASIKMHAPISRVAYGKHEDIRIARNNNCYNKLAMPLSFKQIIYAACYQLKATHSIYMGNTGYKFKYPYRFSISDL